MIIRAWLILTTMVFGVLFNFFPTETRKSPNDPAPKIEVGFPYSEMKLSRHTWWYFTMEHVGIIIIASCLLIKDETPRWLLGMYVGIVFLDMVHYWLFYRDEGIGFNLFKTTIFGIATIWEQIKYLRR